MGASTKAVISLFMIVALVVALFSWIEDRPDQTTWIVRVSSLVVAGLFLAALLKLHFRPDQAPDYLRAACGEYFNRGGFCFSFTAGVEDGACLLQAYYQNQFSHACIGRIALRPARGFFLTRAKIDTITFEIPCEAGGFGIATLPIPLPAEVQGKSQSFEVGASVEYPRGKGKRLRFRDGILIRTNSKFGDSFSTAVTVAGALTGTLVLSTPATVSIVLPSGVAEDLAFKREPRIQSKWKLGDPPFDIDDAVVSVQSNNSEQTDERS